MSGTPERDRQDWRERRDTRNYGLRFAPVALDLPVARLGCWPTFSGILLDHRPPVEEWRKTGDRDELSERGGRQLRTRLGTMNEMGDAKLFCRN